MLRPSLSDLGHFTIDDELVLIAVQSLGDEATTRRLREVLGDILARRVPSGPLRTILGRLEEREFVSKNDLSLHASYEITPAGLAALGMLQRLRDSVRGRSSSGSDTTM